MYGVKAFSNWPIVLAVVTLSSAQTVSASWISWLSVGITIGGIAAASTPTGVGQVVGGVAGVVQVVGVCVDAVKTVSGADPFQPSFAGSPEPAADVGQLAQCSNSVFEPFSFSSTAAPQLQVATDAEIGLLNGLMSDFRMGTTGKLLGDLEAIGSGLNNIANQYDALSFPVTVSQADILSGQSMIGSSGLPATEAIFLSSAGFSSSDIQNFANFVATEPVNLAVSTVSLSQLFHTDAAELVPEPSSLTLGSIALLLAVMYRGKRVRQSGTAQRRH